MPCNENNIRGKSEVDGAADDVLKDFEVCLVLLLFLMLKYEGTLFTSTDKTNPNTFSFLTLFEIDPEKKRGGGSVPPELSFYPVVASDTQ